MRKRDRVIETGAIIANLRVEIAQLETEFDRVIRESNAEIDYVWDMETSDEIPPH